MLCAHVTLLRLWGIQASLVGACWTPRLHTTVLGDVVRESPRGLLHTPRVWSPRMLPCWLWRQCLVVCKVRPRHSPQCHGASLTGSHQCYPSPLFSWPLQILVFCFYCYLIVSVCLFCLFVCLLTKSLINFLIALYFS